MIQQNQPPKQMPRKLTAAMLRRYPDLMTVEEARAALNIGRSTMYKLLKSGEVRSLKISTKYRIPKAYLVEFLNKKAC